MTKVIISSTGQDLGPYRRAAIDTCIALGLAPIAMEQFEAMGMGATEGSRYKMAGADVYIGIYSHRYGYIEPGYRASVTELEYDHARELGIERLCFLVDPSYPWPPDLIDYEHAAALRRFRQRIEQETIRATFTTVDDFTAKLTRALVGWLDRHGTPRPSSLPWNGPAAVGSYRSEVIPTPGLVIGRDQDLQALTKRLREAGDQHRPVIVRGWPGVGKTTVVAALATDRTIASDFPDGVLWASLGQQADVFAHLVRWVQLLGSQAPSTGLEALRDHIQRLLQTRRCLLIVDDVWDTAATATMMVGGPACSTLITTRMPAVAWELATVPDDVYLLRQLDTEHGVELLRHVAPHVVREAPEESRRLTEELEGLPLALRVAGRLLEAERQMGWGISDLLEHLAQGTALLKAQAPPDRFDAESQTIPTVSVLLHKSTDALDEETRERLAFLGVFAPKPATFDLDAMRAVWQADDPRPTVRLLTDRGLLEPLIGTGRFQLHALLALHASSLLKER